MTNLHKGLYRVNLRDADCNCVMHQTETDLSKLVHPYPQITGDTPVPTTTQLGHLKNFYHSCGCMCTDDSHTWL